LLIRGLEGVCTRRSCVRNAKDRDSGKHPHPKNNKPRPLCANGASLKNGRAHGKNPRRSRTENRLDLESARNSSRVVSIPPRIQLTGRSAIDLTKAGALRASSAASRRANARGHLLSHGYAHQSQAAYDARGAMPRRSATRLKSTRWRITDLSTGSRDCVGALIAFDATGRRS
jgi:hypothetical protein